MGSSEACICPLISSARLSLVFLLPDGRWQVLELPRFQAHPPPFLSRAVRLLIPFGTEPGILPKKAVVSFSWRGPGVLAKSQVLGPKNGQRQVQLPDTQQLERWRDALAKLCRWG